MRYILGMTPAFHHRLNWDSTFLLVVSVWMNARTTHSNTLTLNATQHGTSATLLCICLLHQRALLHTWKESEIFHGMTVRNPHLQPNLTFPSNIKKLSKEMLKEYDTVWYMLQVQTWRRHCHVIQRSKLTPITTALIYNNVTEHKCSVYPMFIIVKHTISIEALTTQQYLHLAVSFLQQTNLPKNYFRRGPHILCVFTHVWGFGTLGDQTLTHGASDKY